MIRNFCVFIFLISSSLLLSQNTLTGQWFLNRVTFFDGNNVELNNPYYSMYQELIFNNTEVSIGSSIKDVNATWIPYSFDSKNLKIGKLNYEVRFIEDKSVALISKEDKLVFYYLRAVDFPEDIIEKEKFFLQENDTVYEMSIKHKPYFKNKLEFADFLIKDITPEDKGKLDVEFILGKDGRIRNISITTEKFDEKTNKAFRNNILNSEKYWVNPSKTNIIYRLKFTMDIQDAYSTPKKAEKNKVWDKFNEDLKNAKDLYNRNEFAKAVELYEDAGKTYQTVKGSGENFESAFIAHGKMLGISYLVMRKIDKACNTFTNSGGLGNFEVRNYIINFCQKN